jgi:hypothetical protein
MPDDIRVSILDALSELNPRLDTIKWIQISVAIFCAAALTCAIVLVMVTAQLNHHKNLVDPSSFHFDMDTFYQQTADIFVITLLQIVVFPIVAYLAVRSTKQVMEDHYANADDAFEVAKRPLLSCLRKTSRVVCMPLYLCDCTRCFYNYCCVSKQQRRKNTYSDDGKPSVLSYHLLSTAGVNAQDGDDEENDNGVINNGAGDHNHDKEGSNHVAIDVKPLEGYEAEIRRVQEDKKTVDEAYLSMRKTVDYQKSAWLTVLFVLSTTVQVYIGLKCISFDYTNEAKQGTLMGLGVLWTNIITWLLRELIIRMGSAEEGLLIPALHPHRLHLHQALDAHWCDLCGQQIKDSRAFRCKLCDFDLCMICYSKKDAHTLEGQLRGDKGVRTDEHVMTQWDYIKKAWSLVAEEWMLFSVAILSLCVYNGINLWTPNMQGTILNTVVESDLPKFNLWIRIYLFASIAIGLLGGIQSLCFNIVGRKLANTVRKRLFKGIIVQDIAFFDGNSSGQLTSRLTNDVGFMVSPIQSMLGTLVSNTILLVGGILLCFITSWRLSMLAFTTVGPIVHITQVYAGWSRSLNRRIYGALAAANGYATEALANIRTVKAFANEHQEQGRYDDANNNALLKGIHDALGGAGMYTINSYLELGAGVLILWYGGKMAIDGQDSMSPGKLITYQVCCNCFISISRFCWIMDM